LPSFALDSPPMCWWMAESGINP